MNQLIYMVITLFLLLALYKSFIRDPYSYANIMITSVIVFMVSLFIDNSYVLSVRFLTIPLCFLSLFICISNVVLLGREGFRLHNFLGFIFLCGYLAVINFMWVRFEASVIDITPFIRFIRLYICYFECTILAIWIMGYAVLRIKADYDKDYIIILGCSISKKGKLRPLIKGRVNRAIRFAWEQEWNAEKTALYVPSGGQGDDEPMSEGSAMELYLLSHGAEEQEVLPEKESRNTRENISFSKKIIDGLTKNAKIAIVTSDYHVLRSGMIAGSERINVQMIGSDTKWYFWPNAFFRETVAIILMKIRVHIIVAAVCVLAVITIR